MKTDKIMDRINIFALREKKIGLLEIKLDIENKLIEIDKDIEILDARLQKRNRRREDEN